MNDEVKNEEEEKDQIVLKRVLILDGEPISINAVVMMYEDDSIQVHVTTSVAAARKAAQITEQEVKEAKIAEVIEEHKPVLDQPYTGFATHALPESNMEIIEKSSSLRGTIAEGGIRKIVIIESNTHNIALAGEALNDAVFEIIEEENKWKAEGYGFAAEIDKPTLVFEDEESAMFKIVEKLTIARPLTEKEQ